MKVEEFRIGNLCQEKYSKEVIKVIGISDKDIFFTGKFTGKWQSEEIPLTDEWLLKFGFKKYNNVIYISLNKLKAELQFEIYSDMLCPYIKNDFSDLILDDIKYVHQLQNLYFSLTGTELILQK